jgi:hypothetical protein
MRVESRIGSLTAELYLGLVQIAAATFNSPPIQGFCKSSGSLAIFAVIRRALVTREQLGG